MKLIHREHWFKKPPYKASIRAELTGLVSTVAIISLLILAVTTGVYFTANYKDLRSDRLYIAAQLKSSQIDQTLNYLYYQCYWVSTRDTLQTSLANHAAGNKSASNWVESGDVIAKFLGSSDLFSAARVYDASFRTVLNVTNNGTGNMIPELSLEKLFPLSTNEPLSSSLETSGILTDPVRNASSYLMSMSLPVYANPSIILTQTKVYGYITIVMTAEGLLSVFNDTTALGNTNVAIVSAIYSNKTVLDAYHFVFPPYGAQPNFINEHFKLQNDSFLNDAFKRGKGGSLKSTNFFYSKRVAVGYSPCTFNLANWVAIVSQQESVFLSPSTKLTKIIAGTVVGIGVFVMLITFPLAHWAVQPIVRLQKATELITEGRGLRPVTPGSRAVSRSNSIHSVALMYNNPPVNEEKLLHRNVGFSSSEEHTSLSEKQDNSSLSPISRVSSPHTIQGGPAIGTKTHKVATNSSSVAQPEAPYHGNQPITPIQTQYTSPNNKLTADGHSISGESTTGISSKSKNLITSTNLIEARVPLPRSLFFDELTNLTETFNTMTDALDQHYALLEDRVRARTRELEAAKIQAEAANEAKTVFIANISHELRTPLNDILGMTAILMEERDIDKIRSNLKLIFRSGELLLHILTELLTFSKNVLNRTKLEKRNFCITEVALQIKTIFGKVARDQHVRLSISLTPNIIRTMVLYGDSNRIIQIIMNLVSNALKFTPDDGMVDVRIKLLGEYDQVLSEKHEHKKVFIKPGTEINDPASERAGNINSIFNRKAERSSVTCENPNSNAPIAEDGIKDSLAPKEDGTAPTTRNNEPPSSVREEDEYTDDGEVDDDYSESLASTTTSSYDDAIFNSQFKKIPEVYDEEGHDLGTKLETPKTWVIAVEVEDTGPGIEESLRKSVFEPFVQGDQTLSRQYGGTGLGLSICRQLAIMMNGTMVLESEVGVGSKFTFTVPLPQTRTISFDNIENPFEDEFNPLSKKNRRVKFKDLKGVRNRKSKSSMVTFDEGVKDNDLSPGRPTSLGSDNHNSPKSVSDEGKNAGVDDENITSAHSLYSKHSEHGDASSSKHSHSGKHHHNNKSAISLDRPFLQSTGTATSTGSVPVVNSLDKTFRVLVAEDNHVNQEVIKRMLNLEGIKNIDLACDGQEAFDKVKALTEEKDRYNVIFMDVQMPKVDGLLSTKMIRHDLHYDHPIVALTAFADDSNIRECLDAGMNGFLSKPISRAKLKAIINEHCPEWVEQVKKREEEAKKTETEQNAESKT